MFWSELIRLAAVASQLAVAVASAAAITTVLKYVFGLL
jgi:hypothetical protein